MIVKQIAVIYGINVGTVNYWCNSRLRAYMRAKNAKRRRDHNAEVLQYVNKERRRAIKREQVRIYNKLNNRQYRKARPDFFRKRGTIYARQWRKDNKEHWRASIKSWWHKKKCKCLKYGDHHVYGIGWPKGRKRSKQKEAI